MRPEKAGYALHFSAFNNNLNNQKVKRNEKIVFFLFATMLVASVKAQVYVGGTVGLWHNDDLDATFFKLEPEVGYNLSEKWAVGGVLAFAHGKADKGKYNAFRPRSLCTLLLL